MTVQEAAAVLTTHYRTTQPVQLRPIVDTTRYTALYQECIHACSRWDTTISRLYQLIAEIDHANATSPSAYTDALMVQARQAVIAKLQGRGVK